MGKQERSEVPVQRSTGFYEVLPTTKQVHPGVKVLREVHSQSLESPESFWYRVADELSWYEKTGPVFQAIADPPYGKWFPNWKTNISYNALDRHVQSWRKHKVAFYWESESGEKRTVTYYQLFDEVNRVASALRKIGVEKGDRVAMYMPMVPELPVAMLAAVRIGAIHLVIFSGFSSQAIADRLNDSKSKVVITADIGYRRGKVLQLKQIVDEAVRNSPSVEKVIVLRRGSAPVKLVEGRDVWYHEFVASGDRYVAPEPLEGPHPSFVLYTSGTTGKPKGTTHGTAGYMVWAYYTQRVVFDAKDDHIFWCTSDMGWVTGHSYIVYGPLLNGVTSLMYEGTPDHPQPDRWWELIERYGVNILYTTPTAIRMHMRCGEEWARKHDLTSLKLLGTVGEPINPEAWNWYFKNIGHERTPIVDTYWQTESGGILVTPQPGIASVPLKPGSAMLPIPGVDVDVYTEDGRAAKAMDKGYLVIKRPWPGEFMALWNDPERFKSVYFSRFPGVYYTGDYAMKDEDGYFWLLGRADEVLKVAGHRISTIELEDALISHPAVAESAVIGQADPIKMQVPVAFVILRPGRKPSPELRQDLVNHVRKTIGPIAEPKAVYFVDKLPKTRSGKIMRRVIAAVVEERPIGDITTLEDETSVEEAKKAYAELRAQIQARTG